MNRSWQNTSSNSSGFIYFNTSSNNENNPETNDYTNKSDTNDFLAFSESPPASPQLNRFTPNHYSSPQPKFHRGSPYNKKFQRYSGGGHSSFNSSNNSSFGYNKSWNNRRSFQKETDIMQFLHPTFMEDPWADLERVLKEKQEESVSGNAEEGAGT